MRNYLRRLSTICEKYGVMKNTLYGIIEVEEYLNISYSLPTDFAFTISLLWILVPHRKNGFCSDDRASGPYTDLGLALCKPRYTPSPKEKKLMKTISTLLGKICTKRVFVLLLFAFKQKRAFKPHWLTVGWIWTQGEIHVIFITKKPNNNKNKTNNSNNKNKQLPSRVKIQAILIV